ncbi:MAG: 1-deoxy-D-xylulose-5-phosphate synthase [Clostridiales Family XIII bacterium]|jgi:1-deoxy-D-xylulose-5-phosphate synthase|nr:1-deoxy-D-xylulose-5-phosphate synthase [Clostridiales Family XIII bacterium]
MLKKDITEYVFPDDLKTMGEKELDALSYAIRDFLITNVSATGGHLAPNLGVVDLAIALHMAFDFPRDSIVWDMGHQAYVHKILTGRAAGFPTLRGYGGPSGFPRPSESPCDVYSGGHSGTAVSVAMGLAEARDLRGGKGHVVAVIGDGSLTSGPAFEGLNNAGMKRTRMIVVLNDDGMPVSHGAGSLSPRLTMLRSSTAYLTMKKSIKRKLSSSHGFGEKLLHGMGRVRGLARRTMLAESIFEGMGFSYFGPIDGHNIAELRDVLSGLKDVGGPVLLHVVTKKGKGYKSAEKYPDRFHGAGPFDSITGLPAEAGDKPTWPGECGEELTRLAGEDDRVVAVAAAMAGGTGVPGFAGMFPGRFFDAGISGPHAVAFAAGLAIKGLRPFVAIYSAFMQRAYDQVIEEVALHKLPVTFLLDRAGNVGEGGETHHGVFDISYLSHIPNMRVLAPSDARTLRAMLIYALAGSPGPLAIRYPKGAVHEDVAGGDAPDGLLTVSARIARDRAMAGFLKSGKGRVLHEGGDVTVFAVGCMAEKALDAAGILALEGIGARVVDTLFVKPVDRGGVIEAMGRGAPIVTVEDNMLAGGYGESVNSVLIENNEPLRYMPRVLNMGWPDEFIPHGDRETLMKRYGLDASSIAERIRVFLKNGFAGGGPRGA